MLPTSVLEKTSHNAPVGDCSGAGYHFSTITSKECRQSDRFTFLVSVALSRCDNHLSQDSVSEATLSSAVRTFLFLAEASFRVDLLDSSTL